MSCSILGKMQLTQNSPVRALDSINCIQKGWVVIVQMLGLCVPLSFKNDRSCSIRVA